MRVGLYHGYELSGSGSNEYTKYLAENLSVLGHEVHIVCREPDPEQFAFVSDAIHWDAQASPSPLFNRPPLHGRVVLHQLAHASTRPVFLTDKQRAGRVKSFLHMKEDELAEYHAINAAQLSAILGRERLDVLHANHVIYQPVAALEACESTDTPLVIYPHGSSIEYVLRESPYYQELAGEALERCAGLIIGNQEVRDRILRLYPAQADSLLEKTRIVGVGVDTRLFRPVEPMQRNRSIERLIATGGGGGKKPEQSQELVQRLRVGELQATRDYWSAYPHELPDDDLNSKLRHIDWGKHVLLFVGALTAGKGLQSLIAAMPGILAAHPETQLVIVGSGAYRETLEALVHAISSGDDKLLQALCDKGWDLDRSELKGPWADVRAYLANPENFATVMTSGSAFASRVTFTGRLDHKRLQHLFPCADLAIFPSLVPEAYPLVLMESLSNGVLPLVSYFSGFKDGVDELEPMLGSEISAKMRIGIDSADRIDSIIDGVSELLSSQDLPAIRPRLRRIAVEHYDWRKRAAQMVDAYEQLRLVAV